jgi:hypothetical protein
MKLFRPGKTEFSNSGLLASPHAASESMSANLGCVKKGTKTGSLSICHIFKKIEDPK